MRFNQAVQAPVVIEVGDEKLAVPLFTLGDCVAWQAELDTARTEEATKGLAPLERFQAVSFYSVAPTDMTEIKRLGNCPVGVKRIVTTCVLKAEVVESGGKPTAPPRPKKDAKWVEQFLNANDPDALAVLAKLLCEFKDTSKPQEQPQESATAGKGNRGEDPLSPAATAA